ncbi:MAG: DNA primase DnaG [archaeon]
MAKISPVSIKYVIHAKFIAQGTVEKPDVIGALFGQTEGLLGSDLEMRELQKEGKIGRIDVDLKTESSKTQGNIQIPSALDKAETSIIAAAIETIERVGPTDAKIEVDRIEDVRGNKREYILERAKKLLGQINAESPESREMADNIKISNRLSKLQEYGSEKLPAGDISGEGIIVVEGRADVINLLKAGIDNVIGMNGTHLPEAVKELSYNKEITLFIDGDRGGILIAKNAAENARIDFIVAAPDGKEVEELSSKEILSVLRKKVSVEEFFGGRRERNNYRDSGRRDRSYGDRGRDRSYGDRGRDPVRRDREEGISNVKKSAKELTASDKKKLTGMMSELEDKKQAYLINENLEIIKKLSSGSVASSLQRSRDGVCIVVMDGKVTASVIHAAEKKGVAHIVAKNFAYTNTTINLLSM